MFTSEEILMYVRLQLEKHDGPLRGKTVFGYSGQYLFLTQHLVSGTDEVQFLDALCALYRFEEVSQFFVAFSGHIGEQPTGDTILIISGSTGSAPYISQWSVEKDEKGKFCFRDTCVADLDAADENPLNLLRSAQKMPIQRALQILETAKKSQRNTS